MLCSSNALNAVVDITGVTGDYEKKEKKKPFNVKFFLVCLIAKADGKRQLRTNRGTGSRVSMQIFTLKSQASIIYR